MSELYSDLKIFHFESKIKDILNRRLSVPIHIRLKPTNKCNHNCYYCCYRNKNLYLSQLFNETDEIPWKKMKEVIVDLGQTGVKAVTLSGGGEPLSYPYIYETIERLTNLEIKIAVLTNGSLLKGRVSDILARKSAWVRVSMDAADSKKYSKIRRVDLKEFSNVCNNIAQFAKNKSERCTLGVNFIVMRENYRDVYQFLKLMKSLGVDHVKISESVISTDGEKNKRYHLHILDSVKKQIKKGILNLSDNRFSIIDKVEDFAIESDCYKKGYNWCSFIQCLTVIGADMNVYTCQDKAYTIKGKIGSIKNKSFRELWFSDKTKEKLIKLNPGKDCNHHCTQHRKNILLFDYLNVNKSHLEFV